VLDAVKKIVEPLGIKKVALRAENNPTLDKVDIDVGETAWNAAMRCANSAGLHLWFEPNGELIVGGADYSTPPVATLCCMKDGKRNNFEQADLTFDVSNRFSEVTFLAQSHGKQGQDNKNDLKWVYNDPEMTTYKPKTVVVSDVDNLEEVEAAINDNTKLVLIETLGNPLINIPDLEKLAEIAHKHQIPLVSDNTFATPYLINVFSHGVDIAIHSATKFIGGHGTTIGGVIVDSGRFDWAASGKFPQFVEEDPSYHNLSYTRDVGAAAFIIAVRVQLLRDTGAALSPFNAFLLLQGLETLSLRVERHVQNAEKIVDFLVNHPKVEKVNYPKLADSPYHALAEKYLPKGVGSIFTFHVKGGEAEARKVIDNLEIFSDLANVADAKSLVVHPATTTHGQLSEKDLEAAGVTPNQIRLSIGLENVEDLIEDLRLALEKI